MLRAINIVLFVCFFSILAQAQTFSGFIKYITALPESERQAKVDSFISIPRSYPVTEDTLAHFIFCGSGSSLTVAGDFNGWDNTQGKMTNIAGTNFWYRTENFPGDARLDYKFVAGSNWILDPRNSHTIQGGYGPNSELAMPGYVQPWEIASKPWIQHGSVIQGVILSKIVNRTYQLSIYLPPNYEKDSVKRFPAVYFQDGGEYQSLGSAINILNNLLDSNKIDPVIAVFVKPNDRNDEYAYNNRHNYRQFFATELVPYIDSIYRTIKDPKMRLVLGDSFGGNISALICYYHPDVFANCGQQSGAFQTNNWEASNLLFKGEYKDIKIHSVWGSYEGSLTADWHMGVEALKSKGYKFNARERHEGHSWGLWRANLDEMLIYFFPYGSTTEVNLTKTKPEFFHLDQSYPNPFNPTTKITYSIPEGQNVRLVVYDMLGKEVSALVNEFKSAGSHTVQFNASSLSSGIYIYSIQAGRYRDSKKLILLK